MPCRGAGWHPALLLSGGSCDGQAGLFGGQEEETPSREGPTGSAPVPQVAYFQSALDKLSEAIKLAKVKPRRGLLPQAPGRGSRLRPGVRLRPWLMLSPLPPSLPPGPAGHCAGCTSLCYGRHWRKVSLWGWGWPWSFS